MGPISLGLGQNVISVRPITQTRWDDFGNKQIESWPGKLGGTDSLISVGPKRYEGETESLHCEFGGTDHSSRLDRNVTKGNREFALQTWWDPSLISVQPKHYEGNTESLQSHLGQTEIPIDTTYMTRVSDGGYVK